MTNFRFRVKNKDTGKWYYRSPDKPWGHTDWQQSTGLTDKKGKEIYEGDQVVFDHERGKIWKVEYALKFAGFFATDGDRTFHPLTEDDVEVIGNSFP